MSARVDEKPSGAGNLESLTILRTLLPLPYPLNGPTKTFLRPLFTLPNSEILNLNLQFYQ